jgi:hypothetical protein
VPLMAALCTSASATAQKAAVRLYVRDRRVWA